jgi:Domain of unknown function (DUF222)
LDGLAGLDLVALTSTELVEFTRRVEIARRWLPAVIEHRLVAELEDPGGRAGVPGPLDPGPAPRGLLQITVGEAKTRVAAARNLGQRRSLTGIVLPPLFGAVAAAQAAGVISAAHARVIIDAHDGLPHAVQADHGEDLVRLLVTHAVELDPHALATLARRAEEVLNPDGILTETADHDRRRGVTLAARRDGSFDLTGRLTPMCGARWQAVLDATAAPKPAVDGTRDPRTPGQRNHDAFHDIPNLLMRAEVLPSTAGLTTTLLVTMTADQLQTGQGYASSTHGGLIPAAQLLAAAAAAGQVISVLLDPTGGILNYGHTNASHPQLYGARSRPATAAAPTPAVTNPHPDAKSTTLLPFQPDRETSVDNHAL